MDFQFSLDSIFPEDLMLVGRDLTPKIVDGSLNSSTPSDYYQKNYCKLDPSSRMALGEVLDRMGSASARAQGLSQVITTMEKLRTSENHIVYIITRKDVDRTIDGADICVGFLKVGRKRLFILDSSGGQNEVLPVSVLDFYVHESLQRHGYGRQLFDAMLKTERVDPVHLAIDRPSDKLTSFLAKHYDLRQPCPQMNNFVVYPGFFSDRDGDEIFSVRSALAVSSWLAARRRSSVTSLEPVTVSPSPVVRSFGRRGRRRLVTSCPPPADPRLTRAATQGVPSLPPPLLFSPSMSSPGRPSSVRPGSGLPQPAPLLQDGADYPPRETLPREGSVATRLPAWPVVHPDLWTGRRREPQSSVSDQTLPVRDCTVLGPPAEQPAAALGYPGSHAAEPCPVQSPQETGGILQSGGRLPCRVTQNFDTVSRVEAVHPVPSLHTMGPTFNSDGLFPVPSPRKISTLPQSDWPFASSPPMKTGALLHPDGSFPGEKLHAPSPQKSGTLPHPEGWCAGGKVPSSPHLPTCRCRRSSVCLPACGPPAALPTAPSAAPPVAGPTSASYPYPWLVPKDELFYPNKRQSPLKNGHEVTSMVGVQGSPMFSRHSHDGPAAKPCSAGSRQVRNLHDHHQLW